MTHAEQLSLVPDPPNYWRNETSGILAAAVENYLNNRYVSPNDIRYLRAYCVQWVNSSAWDLNPSGTGKELRELRESAAGIRSVQQLDKWLRAATDAGMDPL
jgi:hypothetical protein